MWVMAYTLKKKHKKVKKVKNKNKKKKKKKWKLSQTLADSGDSTSSFYHGLLPVRQSHGHGAPVSSWWQLTLGEVGFGETMGQCRVCPCCRLQFYLNIFFLFSTLNPKMTKTMCKWCHKVRNGQNLPNKSPNFRNFFFQSNFSDKLGHFSTSLTPYYQNSFFFNFLLALSSRMSRNMCIWLHKLCNAKISVGPTYTWSNEAWYIKIWV